MQAIQEENSIDDQQPNHHGTSIKRTQQRGTKKTKQTNTIVI